MKQKLVWIFLFVSCLALNAQIKISSKYAEQPIEFYQIKAEDIKRDYQKIGFGKKSPHLFFSQEDILRIKDLLKANDPFAHLFLNKMGKEADETLSKPFLTYSLDAANLRVPSLHTFAKCLPQLIFMYQITSDEKYAEYCWKQMEIMADYPDWGADRHFLDTGIGAFNFAMVYDGLHNYLTKEQRKILEEAVMKHAIKPGKYQIENRKGVWQWYFANNNWNGICNSGLISACIAMFEKDPDYFAQIIASAANCLPYYITEFEPDGQSEEGLMYWAYGLMYTTMGFEAMQRNLGTTYGFSQTKGMKKTGWFPIMISGPVQGINVGDDPLPKGRTNSMFWFAKYYSDSALAKQQLNLCIENQRVHWYDIYYYDPTMVKDASQPQIPLDNHIHGIELMSIRENWDSKNAMYIAMHGGANNANHGHLDAGSFYLQSQGEVFAYGNLGRDDYTFPGYFSKNTSPDYNDQIKYQTEAGRWHFYRLRTEGKNCLLINPTIRPEQDEKGEAKVINRKSTRQISSFSLDLSDCYKRDVHSYIRSIVMDRKKQTMRVIDRLETKVKDSEVYWFMHTKANIQINKNGKVAVMDVNGKKMKATIIAPLQATFSQMPASYLLETEYPLTKNTANHEFKKLLIKTKINQGEIEVVFEPIN